MKELAAKIFKFVGASIGVLVAAYTIGWSGAMTLHALFKAEKAQAEIFVKEQVSGAESRVARKHDDDIKRIEEKVSLLHEQGENIQANVRILIKRGN